MYDLLVQNGTLIDPSQDLEDKRDIAISNGKVVAVEKRLPMKAKTIVDATQKVVTPGLIDLHTHVYWGGTSLGVNADLHCLPKGVTTVLDAGSAGWRNFLGFRTFIIENSKTRIVPLLHISSIGLLKPPELEDVRNLEYDDTVKVVKKNRDLIKGLKIRFASPPNNHVGRNGPLALQLAKEAAEDTQGLVMVHPKSMSPGFGLVDILKVLRSGDIVTHCFAPTYPVYFPHAELLDENGQILPEVKRAAKHGIVFDVGHGSGSFYFDTAKKAIADGFLPTTISTDLHVDSLNTAQDLPTTLSKFLALGLPLTQVISKSTSKPAEILGLQETLGTLKPGAEADIAVFTLRKGRFMFVDVKGGRLKGDEFLQPYQVIKSGELVH